MAKRHEFRAGDWDTIAVRLDEIISAHSGEDPFEESLKLLVACLSSQVLPRSRRPFLAEESPDAAPEAVNRLLALASERWRGIIDPGTKSSLNGPELLRCAEVLQAAPILENDLIGLDAIFEFMVNRAAKGKKGQYFTPRHVISEVIRMVDPQPEEHVADPACGSGGFLRHSLTHQPRCSVWGFDQDARAARVARIMLAVSGRNPCQVMRCDSLRRGTSRLFDSSAPSIEELMRAQEPRFRGFDVIVTNPPFAGDVGEEYTDSFDLARGKRVERDVLFVERCVELLQPGGRLAIVLPHNKVGSDQWGYMRQWLLERVQVLAVLGLGRNTFQPHTSQKACVVIGVKREGRTTAFRDEEVLLFVSQRDGKDHRGKTQFTADGITVDHDLSEATDQVRSRLRIALGVEG